MSRLGRQTAQMLKASLSNFLALQQSAGKKMQQTEAKGGSCDERGRHCEIYYHVKASCRVSCGMWIKHNGKDRVM